MGLSLVMNDLSPRHKIGITILNRFYLFINQFDIIYEVIAWLFGISTNNQSYKSVMHSILKMFE